MSVITRNLMMAAGQGNEPVTTVFISGISNLHAYDVSDPTNPTLISSHPADLNRGSVVYSHKRKHIYASSHDDNEIFSIDVSDPSNMSTSQIYSAGRKDCFALDDANDVLYGIRLGSLAAYDVSDPSDISLLDGVTVGSSVGTAPGEGYVVLDLVRRRAIAGNNSDNLIYYMHLIDISDPSNLVSMSSKTNSTDETFTGHTSFGLDVSRGYAFWFTEATLQSHDYTSGSFSQIVKAYSVTNLSERYSTQSHYRARDGIMFAPRDWVYDFSGDTPNATILDTVPADTLIHDDYRMLTFGISTDEELVCFDSSDPTNVIEIGRSAVNSDITYLGNVMIAASAGPNGTRAYGR